MKVAVGLSGGVDSTVAALLLKEQGHEVIGVTMTLGRVDEAQSLADARAAADRLGVPLKVFDLAAAWHTDILHYVCETYLSGATPNPCVRCNEMVKFGLLPQMAFDLGCDCFATGHYARIGVKHGDTEAQSASPLSVSPCLCVQKPYLLRAVDRSKDQSYFLYRVKPEVLARTIFPLGGMTKAEVREKARAFGLAIADKGDSQDFCGGDPMAIVNAAPREGNIVTTGGKVLGHHQGYWNYTIGKRKGLGIGGGTPYYVIGLRAETNEVVVGFKEETVVREFKISDIVGTPPFGLAGRGVLPTQRGPDQEYSQSSGGVGQMRRQDALVLPMQGTVGQGCQLSSGGVGQMRGQDALVLPMQGTVGQGCQLSSGGVGQMCGQDALVLPMQGTGGQGCQLSSGGVGQMRGQDALVLPTKPMVCPCSDDTLMVKVRSAGEPKGPVFWQGDTVICPEGLTGVAPGQSAVFYRGEEIVGGGIIV